VIAPTPDLATEREWFDATAAETERRLDSLEEEFRTRMEAAPDLWLPEGHLITERSLQFATGLVCLLALAAFGGGYLLARYW
jgi:hypothetical protein